MNLLNSSKEVLKLLSKPWKPKNDIYHFKFTKAITKSNVDKFTNALRTLKSQKPQVIALSINSALGSVNEAQIAHDALKQIQEDLQIPVYTFAEDYATGVGYYLLSAGKYVHANPFSIVGDFSVSYDQLNFSKLMKQNGIKLEKFGQQVLLDAFEEVTNEKQQFIQNLLKTELQVIINAVKENRKDAFKNFQENDINQKILTSNFYSAETAKENGLIDEILTFEEFHSQNYPKLSLKELVVDKHSPLVGGYKMYKEFQIFNKINKILTEFAHDQYLLRLEFIQFFRTIMNEQDSQQILNDLIMDQINSIIVNQSFDKHVTTQDI